MSEAQDKLKEQVAWAAGSLHDYNAFLNSPIWLALVKDAQEAMDSMQKELMTPAKTMEEALWKNFVIGKIHGMAVMSINADTTRTALQDEFDNYNKELKNAT